MEEACYEYLGCDKTNCVMYGRKDKQCWEVEGTLCNHKGIELLKSKLKATKKEIICARSGCIYYKAMKLDLKSGDTK